MRISLSPRFGASAGNVLLISLVVSGSLGFVLAGYLTLVGGQNQATIRSLAWNSAIPIAESGIEEALTQLHANELSSESVSTIRFSLRSVPVLTIVDSSTDKQR